MRYVPVVARLLLGAVFLFFGLNGHFHWVEPEPQPERAQAFLDALTNSEFMHPLRGITEALCGALFVIGLWVPLAVVMLAPILVHIAAYHLYLDARPGALGFTAVLFALFLIVAWHHRRNFAGLFRGRIVPAD